MPRALLPNATFKVSLPCDIDVEEDKRPYFMLKYLSGKDWVEVGAIDEAIEKGEVKNTKDIFDKLLNAVKIGIAGWGNMLDPVTDTAIPFNDKNLPLVLNPVDAQELLMLIMSQKPTATDKKNDYRSRPTVWSGV